MRVRWQGSSRLLSQERVLLRQRAARAGSVSRVLGRSKKRVPQSIQEDRPVSLQLIADKLQRLVWRRRLWGIDERQAWHVVHRLDEMYRQLYREQQIHNEALLEQARAEQPVQPKPQAPKAQALQVPPVPQRLIRVQQPVDPKPHRHKRSKGSHGK